jgi:hypothetical protein
MQEIKAKLDTLLALMLSGNASGSVGSGEIINVDVKTDYTLDTLAAGESRDIEVDFNDTAILRSVNFKTVEELPYTVTIKDGPSGVIEYLAESNLSYCYDIINTIYIDSTSTKTLYLNVTNDSGSPINFEHARIRGIEI